MGKYRNRSGRGPKSFGQQGGKLFFDGFARIPPKKPAEAGPTQPLLHETAEEVDVKSTKAWGHFRETPKSFAIPPQPFRPRPKIIWERKIIPRGTQNHLGRKVEILFRRSRPSPADRAGRCSSPRKKCLATGKKGGRWIRQLDIPPPARAGIW